MHGLRDIWGLAGQGSTAHTEPALCQNPTLLWNVETANDTLIPQSLNSSSGLGKYWERHMLGSTYTEHIQPQPNPWAGNHAIFIKTSHPGQCPLLPALESARNAVRHRPGPEPQLSSPQLPDGAMARDTGSGDTAHGAILPPTPRWPQSCPATSVGTVPSCHTTPRWQHCHPATLHLDGQRALSSSLGTANVTTVLLAQDTCVLNGFVQTPFSPQSTSQSTSQAPRHRVPALSPVGHWLPPSIWC